MTWRCRRGYLRESKSKHFPGIHASGRPCSGRVGLQLYHNLTTHLVFVLCPKLCAIWCNSQKSMDTIRLEFKLRFSPQTAQSPEPKKDNLKVYRNTFSLAASSLGSYGYCRFNKMLRLCEYMHRFDARTKYPVLGKVKDDRILDPCCCSHYTLSSPAHFSGQGVKWTNPQHNDHHLDTSCCGCSYTSTVSC